MIAVSVPGPPCVIAKMSVKSESVPSVISRRFVMIVGRGRDVAQARREDEHRERRPAPCVRDADDQERRADEEVLAPVERDQAERAAACENAYQMKAALTSG